ncbi:hypothetical protein HRbin17_01626 [bacterium HR17]|uniref:Uncharacterized protein n=1 Tax=Candidatus Fervidibacter japonicus TaxID=2035412 RepID=A0A2H5XD58_9BACT|nr:hypothetical protein HRbin17_01626 [bacterium HR17]
MATSQWTEVEAFAAVVEQAVRAALGGRRVDPETFRELLMEGQLAVYDALQQIAPVTADIHQQVFRVVYRHIRRILPNYLPQTAALPDDEGRAASEGELTAGRGLTEPQAERLTPLVMAVLLASAPPSERLYVLHTLLDWDKPPRYSQTRLRHRWAKLDWMRLLTGHGRPSERQELFALLCAHAQRGNDRERELAGFALAVLSVQDAAPMTTLTADAVAALLHSPHPVHQLLGLWVTLAQQKGAWLSQWLQSLDFSVMGTVLESRYTRPKDCLCLAPCSHYYPPDHLQVVPDGATVAVVVEGLTQVAQAGRQRLTWTVRWRGRLLAKVAGLYARCLPEILSVFHDVPSHRFSAMLQTIAWARADPQKASEQATEWLPKGTTLLERILRGLRSPEPMERSAALYAARGLPADERLVALRHGLKDGLVFVRFAALRPLDDGNAYTDMERELLTPHEHKHFLHRCILNTMARADLERALEIAKRIYLGREKEMWKKDAWLRHDAGYLLLEGVVRLGRRDLLETFHQVIAYEPHPSPFVLLPAVQALRLED